MRLRPHVRPKEALEAPHSVRRESIRGCPPAPTSTPSPPVATPQIPLGVEDSMKGLVDLVARKAFVFEGPSGDSVVGELAQVQGGAGRDQAVHARHTGPS